LRARGHGDFWSERKILTAESAEAKLAESSEERISRVTIMRLMDRVCAGMLFLLAIAECLLVPRTYTGRIWIFGTGLALLFTAMLNLLRIRNGYGVKGLRMFVIGANVMMLTFFIALMASIGRARTLAHPQVLIVGGLVLVETAFSLGRNI
jgi:hypothetical protein